MLYVIAYDICHPRRLRRVARRMEKHAVRTQKSVFLFEGNDESVSTLLDLLVPLMRLPEDVVQAWKLADDADRSGRVRGAFRSVRPAAVILGGRTVTLIRHSPPTGDRLP